MKGLKLFVRPAEPADEPEVRAFLTSSQQSQEPDRPDGADSSELRAESSSPAGEAESLELRADRFPESRELRADSSFLIGKLLGDLVAVVSFRLEAHDLRVDCIVVREELRKKRIGRVMLSELEGLAAKLDKRQLFVDDAGQAAAFFERVGFRSEGERWVKSVAMQSS